MINAIGGGELNSTRHLSSAQYGMINATAGGALCNFILLCKEIVHNGQYYVLHGLKVRHYIVGIINCYLNWLK